MELLWELKYKMNIAYSLRLWAASSSEQGQPERAAKLFGVDEAIREAANLPLPPVERDFYDRIVSATRDQLGEEDLQKHGLKGVQ